MVEQLLIDGDDCFTIIRKSSVVFNPETPELKCGAEVQYLWPEGAVHRKTYTGIIIAISTDEAKLWKLQAEKLKEAERRIRITRKRKQSKSEEENVLEKNNSVEVLKKKKEKDLRKEANILSAKEMLKSFDEERLNPSSSKFSNSLDRAIRISRNLTSVLEEIKQEFEDSKIKISNSKEVAELEKKNKSLPYVASEKEITLDHTEVNFSSCNLVANYTSSDEDEDYQIKNNNGKEYEDESEKENIDDEISEGEYDEGSMRDLEGNSSRSAIVNDGKEQIFVVTGPGAEAVELIKDSGIYITKKGLKEAHKNATSQTILARTLLCTIFKIEALKTHSLLGRGKNTTQKKPLPIEAVTTILKYAEATAKKSKWKIFGDRVVKDSLRSKLHELQGKQGIKNN